MRVLRKWFRMSMGMAAKPSLELTPKSEKLLELAIGCFGSSEKALAWLKTPHAALGGKAPFELANDEKEGYQAVVDEIGRIEHGIFA